MRVSIQTYFSTFEFERFEFLYYAMSSPYYAYLETACIKLKKQQKCVWLVAIRSPVIFVYIAPVHIDMLLISDWAFLLWPINDMSAYD